MGRRRSRGGPARRELVALLLLLPGLLGVDLLWSDSRLVTRGNRLLAAGRAEDALQLYNQALTQLPNEPGVRFNRGLALSHLGRLPEAQQEFLRASEATDPGLKARSFFNQGNLLLGQKRWREAIEAYRRALIAQPRYLDAQWNLELALQRLREQQEGATRPQAQRPPDPDQQQPASQARRPAQAGDAGVPQPAPTSQSHPESQPAPAATSPDAAPSQHQPAPPQESPAPLPRSAAPPAGASERPRPRQGAAAAPAQGRPAAEPADRSAVEAVLDALERKERNLPLERLRRRVQRRPVRDW